MILVIFGILQVSWLQWRWSCDMKTTLTRCQCQLLSSVGWGDVHCTKFVKVNWVAKKCKSRKIGSKVSQFRPTFEKKNMFLCLQQGARFSIQLLVLTVVALRTFEAAGVEVLFSIEAISKDHRKDCNAMMRQLDDAEKRNMLLGILFTWNHSKEVACNLISLSVDYCDWHSSRTFILLRTIDPSKWLFFSSI